VGDLCLRGDYFPIGNTNAPAFSQNVQSFDNINNSGRPTNLYNGNISYMLSALSRFDTTGIFSNFMGYTYRYDQLNRLVKSLTRVGIPSTAPTAFTWPLGFSERPFESIAYDPNGNIVTYNRRIIYVNNSQTPMDSLSYNYNRDASGNLTTNNRLNFVTDKVAPSTNGDINN